MSDTKGSNAPSLAHRLADLPEDFSDFVDIYERELHPQLAEKEAERKHAWEAAKQRAIVGAVIAVVAAFVGLVILHVPWLAIIGVFVGVGVGASGFPAVNSVSKQAKVMMITPIAAKFGLTYNEQVSQTAEANLLKCNQMKVVPGWDRKTLSDEFIGERNGTAFSFFEAHLEEKRTRRTSNGRTSTYWVTTFRGQCWVMDAPKTFHGTTRVARDSGLLNALGAIGNQFSRAKLEDPEFEKCFEVYTTDQVESRFLLTPDVMVTFMDIEKRYKNAKFRATFHDNKIFVALENGDLFEGGGMMTAIDDPEQVGDLLEDFAVVFHLVDALNK